MKRLILIISISTILFACQATKQMNYVVGNFEGRPHWNGDPNTTLSIKPDSTFILLWNSMNYSGKWNLISTNKVLLKFNEQKDPFFMLLSDVIIDKEIILHFKTKNHISTYNIPLLKRTK